MRSSDWFGPVGIEYAKQYVELEDARKLFSGDRRRVLDHLGRKLAAACVEIKLEVGLAPVSDDDAWAIASIKADYERGRVARSGGTQWSGISIGFVPRGEQGPLFLVVTFWFAVLGREALQHFGLEQVPPDLRAAVGTIDSAYIEDSEGVSSICLDVLRIPSDDVARFEPDAISRELERLPLAFQAADRWMSAALERVKPLANGLPQRQ